MNKISIVIAHYNRFHLLYNTLTSIYNKHNHKDIQIVVVDDGSKILTDKEKIFEFPIDYIQLPESKWYSNPCIPYNIGIEYSCGDIVIIQNPECYHLDDVITHAINNLKMDNYFAYSCYSLPKEIDAITIISRTQLKNRIARYDGCEGWYCHSNFRNFPAHFCSAIYRKNLDLIKNFSREYAYGIGYDDNDLILKLNKANINIDIINDISVLHQHHYSTDPLKTNDQVNRDIAKVAINRLIFAQKT